MGAKFESQPIPGASAAAINSIRELV